MFLRIWDENPVCGNPLVSDLLAGDYDPFAGGFFLAVPCDKVGVRCSVRPACVDRPVGNLLGNARLPGTLVHGAYYQRTYKYSARQNRSRYPVVVGIPTTVTSPVVPTIVTSRMSERWSHKGKTGQNDYCCAQFFHNPVLSIPLFVAYVARYFSVRPSIEYQRSFSGSVPRFPQISAMAS